MNENAGVSAKRVTQLFLSGRKSMLFAAIVLFASALINAQKLPFRSFTTADGLPHNQIRAFYQDKKGFIWIATEEGLSRFDGYNFVNYDDRDGLGDKRINDVLEDADGRLWVANNGGGISLKLNQATGSGARKFATFRVGETPASGRVNELFIDTENFLWCLTDGGLFRAALSDEPVFELINDAASPVGHKSRLLFQASDGHLWFAAGKELFEVEGGHVRSRGEVPFEKKHGISDGFQDSSGRFIVLANDEGPFEFIPPNSQNTIPRWRKLLEDPQNTINFRFIFEDDQKRIWFAGWGGFFKFGDRSLHSAEKQDFGSLDALSMFQDRAGNFWIGTATGIRRISDESLVRFDAIEDVEFPQIKWMVEENGTIKLGFMDIRQQYSEKFKTAEMKGERFSITERYQAIPADNGNYSVYYQLGIWKNGVDFPLERPVLRLRSGRLIDVGKYAEPLISGDGYASFYEDENGFLWFTGNDGALHRIDPGKPMSAERFDCGLAPSDGRSRMVTDHNGGVWIFASAIKRFRDGVCETFDDARLEAARAATGFRDSRGWLWIGTEKDGVAVTEDQAADKPHFRFFNENDGLLNREVRKIVEDRQGRMYFATARGLSRYEPETGRWRSFTSKSGLPSNDISSLFLDSKDNLWILTFGGLAKLNTTLERKNTVPPPVYISRINVAGKEILFDDGGSSADLNTEAEVEAENNNLTIDFVGLEYKNEDSLKYIYRLEGTGDEEMHETRNRSVTFANLSSGSYRFLVYAVNGDGLQSPEPAAFQFRIKPPVYLRWWFLALTVLLVGAIVYIIYRIRLQKLVEIERTRTLIATDLHDDIGSNLSKISVLSEVVRLQLQKKGDTDNELLASISDISRESVASMGDIVWAIDPKRDSILEMIRKMRRQAEETFIPKGVTVEFLGPDEVSKVKLPMDRRRDLYLTYKEALNNIAKHSGCSAVTIRFLIDSGEIVLEIEDDGVGFDTDQPVSGNGLSNIMKRVERMGGTFSLDSGMGSGTRIVIHVPQH